MFNYLSFNNEKILLVTPSAIKNKIREEIMSYNKLLNIKIMSIDEVKNRLFFEPTNKTFTTIYYKYNKPLSIISTLIDYLYYIDVNINYQNEKINELKEIKKHLITNKLLKIDSRFIENIKQYKIKFIGFTSITKETNFIIEELKKYCSIEFIDYYPNKYTPSLIHTKTIEEEIDYVCYSISKLLENKTNINNIKLCNINDDYTFYLKRIFKNYNIPLNLNEKTSLYSLPLSLEFLSLLKENTKEKTLSILKEKYPEYIEYINLYINILNNYAHLDEIDLNLLSYELKNTYLKPKKLNNAVDIIDVEEIGNSNDHIFVMSCNYNYFPKIQKDEEYLLDIEKTQINISTSKDKNNNNIKDILKLIHSSEHIYLSYKELSYFNEYFSLDFLKHLEKKDYVKNVMTSYSINEDKILLTKLLDNKIYNNKTYILNKNYDVKYLEYDYNFKGFDEELLNDLFKDSLLRISYSKLNTFYECPFKYYISNILNLDEFSSSVYTTIGNIMHRVLEHCYNPDFDFEKIFEESKNMFLKDVNFKDSELFFIDNIKDRTFAACEQLKIKNEFTNLSNVLHERKVSFEKTINNHKIKIKGFIDKIIYKEINNILYAAIIDLKTGADSIDPRLFEYGLNLQLPFYTYLLKNDNDFKNTKILGLYINNILNKVNDENTLKLNGYTLNDQSILNILDKTHISSSLIKSLRITKENKFDSDSKIIEQEELDNLPKLVENKIEEMVNKIYQRDFKMQPKYIEKNDVSCAYCKYFAICYKRKEDYKYLNKTKGANKNA